MTNIPSAYKIQAVMSAATAFVDRMRAEDPDTVDDAATLLMMLESETDATELLARVIRVSLEADFLADAVEARMKDLSARRDRFNRRKEDARATSIQIMEALGLTKFPHAEFSASIRPGLTGSFIVNESMIPGYLMKHPPATPDKSEINKLIRAGETVPGVEATNGGTSIAIRVK